MQPTKSVDCPLANNNRKPRITKLQESAFKKKFVHLKLIDPVSRKGVFKRQI